MENIYKIIIDKQINRGTFGSVSSVRIEKQKSYQNETDCIPNNRIFALKTLSSSILNGNKQEPLSRADFHSNLIRELCTTPKYDEQDMLELKFPSIFTIWFGHSDEQYGIPETNTAYILQKKFSLDCGTLFFNKALKTSDKSNLYFCILKSLSYLHERNIVHRDLKPANILYHKILNQYAVTDFGQSSLLEGQSTQKMIVCTRDTRAPELCLTENSNNQVSFAQGVECDVWSFGIVVLCAEMNKSCQPLIEMDSVKDNQSQKLREIIRERFQGMFHDHDAQFGLDNIPFTMNIREILARMIFGSKTSKDLQEKEKQIPFTVNLSNAYLVQNSLVLNPTKRKSVHELLESLRIPRQRKIKRKSAFEIEQSITMMNSSTSLSSSKEIFIQNQYLLDGTLYKQFPLPLYKVNKQVEGKRFGTLQTMLVLLRCLQKNISYPDFLLVAMDFFDRLYSLKSIERMKTLFYTAASQYSIIDFEKNETMMTMSKLFSQERAVSEVYDNYDLIILSIYLADHCLHYGVIASIKTLIEKTFPTIWKGFSSTFSGLLSSNRDQFLYYYKQFVFLKEKFLSHCFTECLASLQFNLVEDSLLFLLRKLHQDKNPIVVSHVLKLLETTPSYEISEEKMMSFVVEDKPIVLKWGKEEHKNEEYRKDFLVKY